MDHQYEEFSKTMNNLLLLNLSNRLKYKKETEHMDPVHYALEFATVRFDIGRRIGKTKYIQQNADKGDVVVLANRMMEGLYKKVYGEFDVLTIDIIQRHPRLLEYKNIYVDEPMMVFKNSESFYEFYTRMTYPEKLQTFILLGR